MGRFSEWPPRYSEYGIPTFPVTIDGQENELFRFCMMVTRDCSSLDRLIAAARARNRQSCRPS